MGSSFKLGYDGLVKRTVMRHTEPTFTPALDAWPNAGVYQLWIGLRRPVKVCVGRLGAIHFAEGTYIYTGRAARGLRARVLRHVRGAERLHWHIDYLLAQHGARVERGYMPSGGLGTVTITKWSSAVPSGLGSDTPNRALLPRVMLFTSSALRPLM